MNRYKRDLLEQCTRSLDEELLKKSPSPYKIAWPLLALQKLKAFDELNRYLSRIVSREFNEWFTKAKDINDYRFHVGLLRIASLSKTLREKVLKDEEYISKMERMARSLLTINKTASYELQVSLLHLKTCHERTGIEKSLARSLGEEITSRTEVHLDLSLAILALELDIITNDIMDHFLKNFNLMLQSSDSRTLYLAALVIVRIANLREYLKARIEILWHRLLDALKNAAELLRTAPLKYLKL